MAITTLPTAPSRQRPSLFADEADAFLGALPTFGDEANALAIDVNANAAVVAQSVSDVAALAALAAQSSQSAQASANFKGSWTSLSGALNIPASVFYNNKLWFLLNNLVDVTASEPGVSGDWQEIGSVTTDGYQTLSNKTLGISSYTQIADASLGTGTHTFDYSAGDMQQLTATGDITIAFSNFVTGKVCTMIIDAVNWGDYTITHPAAMLFAAATAPTYTSGGTDRLMIVKDKDDIYSLFIIGQAVAVVA